MNLRLNVQATKSLILISLLVILGTMASNAQRKKVTSKKQYVKLIKLRAAIEADPNNLSLHEAFINAWGGDTVLEIQYKKWIKRYPKSAIVPFAIGKMFVDGEDPKGRKYLLEAVTRNPRLAEAWELLGIDEMM